jgi:mRNA interferase MazF
MIEPGTIVLFRYPHSNLQQGKLRPALLLKQVPNEYGDWVVAMISTRLHQQIQELEICVLESDPLFEGTGLKKSSLIRTSRLAVVASEIFVGKLGTLDKENLAEVLNRLSAWFKP